MGGECACAALGPNHGKKEPLIIALGAAVSLIALDSSWPTLAGNLNACDEAQLAARAAIASAYRLAFADVDARVARSRESADDPATVSTQATAAGARSLDLVALRTDLEQQEAQNVGLDGRRVEIDCRGGSASIADIARAAPEFATRSIASVLARHGASGDVPERPR
jgi:hypothetical protein